MTASGNSLQEISDTIEHLAQRWEQADKHILRRVFPLIAQGRPVSVDAVAKAVGTGISDVQQELLLGRAGRDGLGRVTELFGLTLSPTLHRVEVDQIALYSCCALVSHVVPKLLGRTVKVESVDPVGRKIVRLTITPNGVLSVEPSEAVGTLIVTDESGVKEDASSNFCSHVHHFVSTDSAMRFVDGNRKRYILGIEDFHEAGNRLYLKIWG